MRNSASVEFRGGHSSLDLSASALLEAIRPLRVVCFHFSLGYSGNDKRHVVGSRAAAPGRYTVNEFLLHVRKRQRRSLTCHFGESIDAEQLLLRIEAFGETVGADHHAIARLYGNFDRRFTVHSIC